jgi:hypothetical protein
MNYWLEAVSRPEAIVIVAQGRSRSGPVLRWQLPIADKILRRDEDPPIPIPPGEDLPSPIKEPPDGPVDDPPGPMREPGPEPPTHL